MSGRSWESRGRPEEGLAEIDRTALVAWAAIVAALACAASTYRLAYSHHFAVVRDPAFPQWWEWSDQSRYYRAAHAWATGSLDPSQHWYFAGYPLLGAAMFRLAPGHPFYLVDLVCLLLSGLLLALLAGRLSDPPALGRAAGALVFVGTVVMTPYQMKSFVEPWTTTPTAPLSLGALLLAFRLWEQPTPRRAATLGLVAGSVLLFRPVDAAPLALAVSASTAWALRSRLPRIAAAGLVGAAIPVAVAAATYLAVFGPHQSPYLQQSAQTGFEWRLIPLHWVTLFVSPLPEFRNEFSLSQTFPWIIPGFVGMVASLVASRGAARRRHALVVGAVLLHCLLYLAYRDLHPQGLFRFGNYHYFKWCLPVFSVYTALLLTDIVTRRRIGALACGLVVTTALFSWRMTWREVPAPWLSEAKIDGGHTLLLPHPPRSVYDGLFVPAEGAAAQIYLASYEMHVADRIFAANADFKAFPTEGGLILTVLRPMPDGLTRIAFPADVTLRPGRLRLLHVHLFWRWPHVAEVATTYYGRWQHDD